MDEDVPPPPVVLEEVEDVEWEETTPIEGWTPDDEEPETTTEFPLKAEESEEGTFPNYYMLRMNGRDDDDVIHPGQEQEEWKERCELGYSSKGTNTKEERWIEEKTKYTLSALNWITCDWKGFPILPPKYWEAQSATETADERDDAPGWWWWWWCRAAAAAAAAAAADSTAEHPCHGLLGLDEDRTLLDPWVDPITEMHIKEKAKKEKNNQLQSGKWEEREMS